jgi:glycosyltransferase involved in cell wall biosynthesis
MVSLGGLYSYLRGILPELHRQGCTTGLLWSARVAGASFPIVDWEHELKEGGTLLGRQQRLATAVLRTIDSFQPDTVLSLLPQSDLACALVRRKSSIPWVAMIHGRPFPGVGEQAVHRRLPWQLSLRWAYRRADRVLAVSEALAIDMAQELHRPTIGVVHNGVAIADGLFTSADNGADPVLGFIGRLSHEKAPDLFVEIARKMGVRARIYGDGPLYEQVTRTAAETARIEVCGWTSRDEAFKEIDLLLMPSRREGLPLVALEAGARGCCVIARRIGGVPEVFERDPRLAAMCLVGSQASAHDFAAAAQPLLDDATLRRDLGARLRYIVERDFRLDRQVGRLVTATLTASD